ncbi:MAG: sodium-dependent bicarbonate transport family permease [Blastochloris sp.]|nr:sodium-dependent bicarbonate transport family permease [Blastochloris sp.]
MEAFELLRVNLLSPVVLAFLAGMAATLIRSELEFPQPVLNAISIYLVFSIALQGGTELSEVRLEEVWAPVLAATAAAFLLPIATYLSARRLLKLDVANAAGLAALFGSVSSVTFLAAVGFAEKMGTPSEPFLPALVSIMEWGILVALVIALPGHAKNQEAPWAGLGPIAIETLRGRSVILIISGLIIGFLIGPEGFQPVAPVFKDAFRGVLMLFLLEMGMVAARQLRDFFRLGPRLLIFGTLQPLVHGLIGVAVGHLAGLSPGGAFVFGAICGSASYIDAPVAVRATLPQANPGIYLTTSLGITFPFNLLLGLPLYYQFSLWLD